MELWHQSRYIDVPIFRFVVVDVVVVVVVVVVVSPSDVTPFNV